MVTLHDTSECEQPGTDWLEGENEDDCPVDVDPNWDSALFLLRATKELAFSHT